VFCGLRLCAITYQKRPTLYFCWTPTGPELAILCLVTAIPLALPFHLLQQQQQQQQRPLTSIFILPLIIFLTDATIDLAREFFQKVIYGGRWIIWRRQIAGLFLLCTVVRKRYVTKCSQQVILWQTKTQERRARHPYNYHPLFRAFAVLYAESIKYASEFGRMAGKLLLATMWQTRCWTGSPSFCICNW